MKSAAESQHALKGASEVVRQKWQVLEKTNILSSPKAFFSRSYNNNSDCVCGTIITSCKDRDESLAKNCIPVQNSQNYHFG